MREKPEEKDLGRAVSEFLRHEVMSQMDGRVGFHVRVAANLVDTLAREAALGPSAKIREHEGLRSLTGLDGDTEILAEELCRLIRDGEVPLDDPSLLQHLWLTTLDTLAIDQPKYATYRAIRETFKESGRNNS